MRIDFLIGDTPYGSTSYFSKSFQKALKKKGVDGRLFWIGDGNFFQAFYEISQDPPDLTCSFSDITVGEKALLGEMWRIPHLSMLIDPAIYFLHHLKGDYSWVSCVDHQDFEWISNFFSPTFFLPHAAPSDLYHPCDAERPLEVVFFGTCIDIDVVEQGWKERFSIREANLLRELSEKVLTSSSLSILQALFEYGISENLQLFHHEIDLYVRGRDRIELIRSFETKEVCIWGNGPWKKYLSKAMIHPPIPFEETLTVMKSAQIVLNSSPRFKHGSHERIFHALCCGSAVVTGESSFVEASFKDGEHLLIYPYGKWDQIHDKMDCDLKQIAQNGQEVVYQSHTWEKRAEKLIEKAFINFK